MKAIRYYGPGNLAVEDMPQPSLSAGEVLVRVKACGICATDVKTYRRGHPKILPGAVLGHEIAGRIAAVQDAPGWQVGQRVVVAPYVPCGECYDCQRGHFTTCERLFEEAVDPGGFVEFVRVLPRLVRSGLLAVPDHLSDEVASFVEPVACCIHGLEALELNSLDTLFIIGDGTMGLLQSMVARAMGVRRILLSGMSPDRLAIAAGLVDGLIDASQQDVAQALQRLAPQGADKVIVSVADPATAESALQYVRKSGMLNIYAGMPKGVRISIDPNIIHYDEVRILGTFGFTPANFRRSLDLLSSGAVDPTPLVSAVVQFDGIRQALEDAADYRGIKFIVQFPEEEKTT
jgi:L-iditol 2-dehydrogenase